MDFFLPVDQETREKHSLFWVLNWRYVPLSNLFYCTIKSLFAFCPVCKIQNLLWYRLVNTVWKHLALEVQWFEIAQGLWEPFIKEPVTLLGVTSVQGNKAYPSVNLSPLEWEDLYNVSWLRPQTLNQIAWVWIPAVLLSSPSLNSCLRFPICKILTRLLDGFHVLTSYNLGKCFSHQKHSMIFRFYGQTQTCWKRVLVTRLASPNADSGAQRESGWFRICWAAQNHAGPGALPVGLVRGAGGCPDS